MEYERKDRERGNVGNENGEEKKKKRKRMMPLVGGRMFSFFWKKKIKDCGRVSAEVERDERDSHH